MAELLRFAPLQSCVDVSFWSELGERKLDAYRLSEEPVGIAGRFQASQYVEVPGQVQLDANAFNEHLVTASNSHSVPGQLLLLNTLESFRSCSKEDLIAKAAADIWRHILSGEAESSPRLLVRFLLLAHADLKHFHFHYWFAFPALKPPEPFLVEETKTLRSALGDTADQVAAACDRHRTQQSDAEPFWLLQLPSATSDGSSQAPQALPLTAWPSASCSNQQLLLVASDSSNLPAHPGWVLRNVLLMAAVRWQVQMLTHQPLHAHGIARTTHSSLTIKASLQVLCVRDSRGRADPDRCLLLRVRLPAIPGDWCRDAVPAAVGWEANAQGKTAPRFLDLSPTLRPEALAEQAVDLNLRLMRWRALPALQLDPLARARCLLLGAGTLGCAVARTLLAWGVRHITFLDNSRVSYSNPVRQSLYTFQDCLQGGLPKAAAAAAALKAIFPSVVSEGIALCIPMPGHPPANDQHEASMHNDAEELDRLVQAHDVVFLLTDTRESRWLPTLLCAAYGKIAITAAIGFDGFLVMRHGAPPLPVDPAGTAAADMPATAATAADAAATAADAAPVSSSADTHNHQAQSESTQPGSAQTAADVKDTRLGCYFCNDVVAPLNSTRDRSLDQQCTVARPGLAPIAGAIAAEMVAALLQHPAGVTAPPPSSDRASPALGSIPHQVRGHLSAFSQQCMEGRAFSQCTACSATVVQQYRKRGWEFLRQAVKEPGSLEELTGLAELQRQAASLISDIEEADEGEDQPQPGTPGPAGAPGSCTGSGPQGTAIERADDGVEDDWTEL